MTRIALSAMLALGAGLALGPDVASAQQTPLQRAEAAYQEIEFAQTQRFALEALRQGGHTPAQLARIYQLLGIAAAALGHQDEARDYFVRMLGIDPDAQLDASVPPRLRDGYLEARGVWAARQGRLGIEVGLNREQSSLRVQLTDPTDLARRVLVHARLEGAAQYGTTNAEARSLVDVSVPGADAADRLEYFVEVLDEHGNQLLAEGSAFQPRVVGRTPMQVVTQPGPTAGRTVLEEPAFWIVAAAVAVVAAGVTTSIVVVDQRSRIGGQTSVSIGLP
ncbi:MAG: tetratricopeptide repeat protein [Sandaracinaceae bacterium]|nr:tetratricopeptide repeat protein [Sandaracinaceae bacterium]